MLHLLAQIVAAIYILYGLLLLLVVSFPNNRAEMFWNPERLWLGWFAASHAIFTALALVACGFFILSGSASIAVGLAWFTLAIIFAGKIVGLIVGELYSPCKRCMLIGLLAPIATTLVIVFGI